MCKYFNGWFMFQKNYFQDERELAAFIENMTE